MKPDSAETTELPAETAELTVASPAVEWTEFRGHVVLAVVDDCGGRAIGDAQPSSDTMNLSAIQVPESAQRQGRGTTLLETFADEARQRGYKKITAVLSNDTVLSRFIDVFGQEKLDIRDWSRGVKPQSATRLRVTENPLDVTVEL